MTMENFLQKEREIDKICDDWTKFIEALEFQKETRMLGWNPGDIVYFQKQK